MDTSDHFMFKNNECWTAFHDHTRAEVAALLKREKRRMIAARAAKPTKEEIDAEERKKTLIMMKSKCAYFVEPDCFAENYRHIIFVLPSGRLLQKRFHGREGMEIICDVLMAQPDVGFFFEVFRHGKRVKFEREWYHETVVEEMKSYKMVLNPLYALPLRFGEFLPDTMDATLEVFNIKMEDPSNKPKKKEPLFA